MSRPRLFTGFFILSIVLLAACAPRPETNVLSYLLAERLGTLEETPVTATGALAGVVLHDGEPISGASVVVAERTGRPHAAQTGADGRYRIEGIPPGQYAPAAVAPGYVETSPVDPLGIPRLITIRADATVEAPPIELAPYLPVSLPDDLARAVELTPTASYTATALFPPGSAAQVHAFQFERDGVVNDSVRVYLPLDVPPDAKLSLLFFVYPGVVDGWEPVSVAFAAQGYVLVALSPVAAWGVDVDQHAYDARIALALAFDGALSPHVGGERAVALGGSFSSAILHRLLRDEGDRMAGWVTVGGIADAFAAAADFYSGRMEIPPAYRYLIPALGPPNIFPLSFLRYSPVYSAAQLPPTLIVHTAADRILAIDQAYALETAARAGGVPVETFYYQDVSHYLQIDENMTAESKALFYRILEFVAHLGLEPA